MLLRRLSARLMRDVSRRIPTAAARTVGCAIRVPAQWRTAVIGRARYVLKCKGKPWPRNQPDRFLRSQAAAVIASCSRASTCSTLGQSAGLRERT